MTKNKILYEYLDTIYIQNMESNYSSICKKFQKKSSFAHKIYNIAAVFLITIVIGAISSSIYAKRNWEKEYEEYKNRSKETLNTIIDINMEKEKNVKNLNMDYVYNDNIGIKLNKVSISEYCYQIDISFKSDDLGNAFNFGYAIYDENNNVYWVEERYKDGSGTSLPYYKKLYKELEINEKEEYLAKSVRESRNSQDNETTVRISLYSIDGFSKNSKLYVRIFDIGYTLTDETIKDDIVITEDAEDFVLSNSEWQFNIEIPNEYYSINHQNFVLASNIDKMEIKNISLSAENYLTMDINTDYTEIEIFDKFTIIDENGKVYRLFDFGKLDNGNIRAIFHIDEESLKTKLYFNIELEKYNINDKVELIKE